MHRHLDRLGLALPVDLHMVQKQSNDLSPIRSPGCRRGPERWQVVGQRANPLAISRADRTRLLGLKSGVVFFLVSQRRQGLFPAMFQFPGDQAVLRLGRVVLPPGPIRFVLRPLQLLPPRGMDPIAVATEMFRRTQTEFQGGRLHRVQHQGLDQAVDRDCRDALARHPHPLVVAGVAGIAGLAYLVRPAGDHGRAAASAARHAIQQRRRPVGFLLGSRPRSPRHAAVILPYRPR
jgi:hypothetical protein